MSDRIIGKKIDNLVVQNKTNSTFYDSIKNIRPTIIPKTLQIETINGICNLKCIMCTWPSWSRKKETMSVNNFKKIIEKFHPYKHHIEYVTFQGQAEALLDKEIHKKIQITKDLEFQGTGLSTNCSYLTKSKSKDLLSAGLDTLICSIDGIKAETHEKIRPGSDYNECIKSIQNYIDIRNMHNSKGRVVLRFVAQELNKDEWHEYQNYWSQFLDPEKGDTILWLAEHNWGTLLESNLHPVNDSIVCADLFDRMTIYANGDMGLCCGDVNGFFKIGNILESNPIDLYNSEIFQTYRTSMLNGRKSELQHCQDCTIPSTRYKNEMMNNKG